MVSRFNYKSDHCQILAEFASIDTAKDLLKSVSSSLVPSELRFGTLRTITKLRPFLLTPFMGIL